jgi:putative ABC transport system permease protein
MYPSMSTAARASILEGFVALTSNPLRTALAMLGIVIGVTSVITTLVLIDGLERYLRDRTTAETDAQSMTVASRTAIVRDGFSYPIGGYPIFTPDVAADLERWLGRTAEVTMIATGTATLAAPGADAHLVAVTATLANYLSFGRKDVEAGRYFTDGEAWRNAPVIVLSHRLAAELSPTGEAASMVGRLVRVHGRPVSVVGVTPPYTGEEGYRAFVPLRAAHVTFSTAGLITPSLIVRASTLESVSAVQTDVEGWLASRYRQSDRRVTVRTSAAQLEQITSALRVLKFVMGSLAGVSLIVGVVGIMNVLLASIAERTREIGVRKALGARRRDVLLQFLAEAVAIAGLGSGLGTIGGCTLAFVLAAMMRSMLPGIPWQTVITPDTIMTGVLSAASIGLAAGTLPAVHAARLSPIEAMRRD